jgi:zinc protease
MKPLKKYLSKIIIGVAILSVMHLMGDRLLSMESAAASKENNPLQILEKNIPPLAFQVIHSQKLKNSLGQDVYYLNDPELPVVNIRLVIKSGSFQDPRGKEGLGEMFARVWRQSGSKKYPGKSLSAYFEFIGGSLEANFESEYGGVTLAILKKYLNDSLPRFKDFIEKPIFDPHKLELERGLKLDALKRSMDSPFPLALRYFRQKAFQGMDYAAVESIQSLKNISLADLKAFYQENFSRDNLAWIITGDISSEEALKLSTELNLPEKGLLGQKNQGKTLSLEKPDNAVPRARIFIINRESPQSTIVIGGPSLKHNHPDRLKLMAANFILGSGGFNSHLMKEIRSARGLAYAVGSKVSEFRDFGVFIAYAQTKNSSVPLVIKLIREQMRKMQSKAISAEELGWAKKSLINQFVFLFTSTDKIALREFGLDFDEMPADYLDNFTINILKVTGQDIQKISGSIFRQDTFNVFIVGPAKKLAKDLQGMGTVITIEPEI